jgi:hypothetical protein
MAEASIMHEGSWERLKENSGGPAANQDGKLSINRVCADTSIFRGNGEFSKPVQAGVTDPFETAAQSPGAVPQKRHGLLIRAKRESMSVR